MQLPFKNQSTAATLVLLGLLTVGLDAPALERGFTSLFDGKTLKGWTLAGKKGDGYVVRDGHIVCTEGGGGNLLTEKEYGDFILRLEYRVGPGGNNGVGIRAPLTDKQIAYYGMEIQVLDDDHPKYANLKPWQFCGSIYGVTPARRGATKAAGMWNSMEITAIGRRMQVKLNGRKVVDANLNDVTDPQIIESHPGMLRAVGRIGLLGHNDEVAFRNIRIKELRGTILDNQPPEGFTALFNGRNLDGWRGLLHAPYDNPYKRDTLSIDDYVTRQLKADARMRENWQAANGMIAYVGDGFDNLVTDRDYGNCELQVDWRVEPDADSGIYLRGCPQVQIWDTFGKDLLARVGSGGLFNNKTAPDKPLVRADRFTGEWNRFRIVMIENRVTIFLNDQLVVHGGKQGVPLENYWKRDLPLPPLGPIELQAHKTRVQFKNIFIRELP